jgi:hypothetical protein
MGALRPWHVGVLGCVCLVVVAVVVGIVLLVRAARK